MRNEPNTSHVQLERKKQRNKIERVRTSRLAAATTTTAAAAAFNASKPAGQQEGRNRETATGEYGPYTVATAGFTEVPDVPSQPTDSRRPCDSRSRRAKRRTDGQLSANRSKAGRQAGRRGLPSGVADHDTVSAVGQACRKASERASKRAGQPANGRSVLTVSHKWMVPAKKVIFSTPFKIECRRTGHRSRRSCFCCSTVTESVMSVTSKDETFFWQDGNIVM